jgi:hypothetical protein
VDAGKVRYGEKSYPLPNGQRIGYRHAEADWQITDADALFAWAKGRGLVRVQEETDWALQEQAPENLRLAASH